MMENGPPSWKPSLKGITWLTGNLHPSKTFFEMPESTWNTTRWSRTWKWTTLATSIFTIFFGHLSCSLSLYIVTIFCKICNIYEDKLATCLGRRRAIKESFNRFNNSRNLSRFSKNLKKPQKIPSLPLNFENRVETRFDGDCSDWARYDLITLFMVISRWFKV